MLPFQSPNLIPLYVALGVGCALVALALWKKLLSVWASVFAFVLLAVNSLATGYLGLTVLVFSFLGAGLLGKISPVKRAKVERELHKKSGTRDAVQVIVNGLPSFAFAIGYFFSGIPALMYASVVAIAAGFADSSASEIGVLSTAAPRSIITLKPVPKGISGGVSLLGTVAALVASFAACAFVFAFAEADWRVYFVMSVAAFSGTLFDSLLGATLQAKYRCRVCNILTEKTVHCSEKTDFESGLRFVDNDLVNLLASTFAAALSLLTIIFTA